MVFKMNEKRQSTVTLTGDDSETDDRQLNDIDKHIVNSGFFNDHMFFVGKIKRWQYFSNEDYIKPDWFLFYVLPLYTILQRPNVLLKKNILGDEEIFCLLLTGQAGKEVVNKWSLYNDNTNNCAIAFTCIEFMDQKYRLNGHSFLCVTMITGSTVLIIDDIEEVDESNELHEAMISNCIVPDWTRSLFERTTRNVLVMEIRRHLCAPYPHHLPNDDTSEMQQRVIKMSRSNRTEVPMTRPRTVDRQSNATSLENKTSVTPVAFNTTTNLESIATIRRLSSALSKRRVIVKNIAPVGVPSPSTKQIYVTSIASATNDSRMSTTIERIASPFQVVDNIQRRENITSNGISSQSQIRSRGVYDEEFDRYLQNAPPSFTTDNTLADTCSPRFDQLQLTNSDR